MSWSRLLWGVALTTNHGTASMWHKAISNDWGYPGEPTRALLFTTRTAARVWCAEQNATWAARPDGDVCQAWRVRPVRVRETIREVQ